MTKTTKTSAASLHVPGLWETGASTETDLQLARDASRLLAAYLDHETKPPLRLRPERNGVVSSLPLTIPYPAARLLERMLTEMGHGGALHLLPVPAEFTTQQAADYLHVSRPHIVRLMKEGTLPHRLVGSHRRVSLKDLVQYQRDQENAWWRYLRREPNSTFKPILDPLTNFGP